MLHLPLAQEKLASSIFTDNADQQGQYRRPATAYVVCAYVSVQEVCNHDKQGYACTLWVQSTPQ